MTGAIRHMEHVDRILSNRLPYIHFHAFWSVERLAHCVAQERPCTKESVQAKLEVHSESASSVSSALFVYVLPFKPLKTSALPLDSAIAYIFTGLVGPPKEVQLPVRCTRQARPISSGRHGPGGDDVGPRAGGGREAPKIGKVDLQREGVRELGRGRGRGREREGGRERESTGGGGLGV